MTEKTVLLSRIEQIMRLGKTPAPYQALGKAEIDRVINSAFEKYKDTQKPVIRVGSNGDPEVLINSSRKKHGIEPVWTKLSSHMAKNELLLSENWLKTKHDPAKPIKLRGQQGTPFASLTRKADVDRAVKNFTSVLTAAAKNPQIFSPERFISKKQTQYDNQPLGEGRHVDIKTNEPLPELKRTDTKDDKGNIVGSDWARPSMTSADETDPREHYIALRDAIASAVPVEEMNGIREKVGHSKQFAPYYRNGRLQTGDDEYGREQRKEFDEAVNAAKQAKINQYFAEYVNADYDDTEDTEGTGGFRDPEDVANPELLAKFKQAYLSAQNEELAHREGVNIAEREARKGQHIEQRMQPWHRQLHVRVDVADPNNEKGAVGIWEYRDKDGNWRKEHIKGHEVYKFEGLGDIIVQHLKGMRTRVFVPSKDVAKYRIDKNLNAPRTFTNDRAVGAMIKAYYEQRVPIPDTYNPPPLPYRDWQIIAGIQDRLYNKAMDEALAIPNEKKQKACVKAVEAKYGAWNQARSHKGEAYEQAWHDWVTTKFNELVPFEEFQEFKVIRDKVNTREDVSAKELTFHDDMLDLIRRLKGKNSRKEFEASFEQDSMAKHLSGFSPLDSPDVSSPTSNPASLAEDALNFEINKRVRATPAGKEAAKWRELANASRERIETYKESKNLTPEDAEAGLMGSPYYKKKKDAGDYEDEAAGEEYDDTDDDELTGKTILDANGNPITQGMSEDSEELPEFKKKKGKKAEEETDADAYDEEEVDDLPDDEQEGMSPEDAEDEMEEPEAPKPVDEGKKKGEERGEGIEELRLEWLTLRAKRAATQSNIEYAKAKAAITGNTITMSGLYGDDNKTVYDLKIAPTGKTKILNKRPMSVKDMYNGFYAFSQDAEDFFTSTQFNIKEYPSEEVLAAQKAISRRAWGMAWEQKIGPEPADIEELPPQPSSGGGWPKHSFDPHSKWVQRVENAARIAAEDKDYATLDSLYEAFPKYTQSFRNTIDPRELSADEKSIRARRIAERNAQAAKLKTTVPQAYSLRSPDLMDGETKDQYKTRHAAWGKDLLNRYKKASPDEKAKMIDQYKHTVAAKPNEQHPLDVIPEVKQVRDTLMSDKKAVEVKRDIDDVMARVTDKSFRNAVRDANKVHITSKPKMEEFINEEVAKRKEEALQKIEQDRNITINREDYTFAPKEGGIKTPPPQKTFTTQVTGKTSSKAKPTASKRIERDQGLGGDEGAYPKPKEEPPVSEETFTDPFFGGEKKKEEATPEPIVTPEPEVVVEKKKKPAKTVGEIKEKIKRVSRKPEKVEEPIITKPKAKEESNVEFNIEDFADMFDDEAPPTSVKKPKIPKKPSTKSDFNIDDFADMFDDEQPPAPKTQIPKPPKKPTGGVDFNIEDFADMFGDE